MAADLRSTDPDVHKGALEGDRPNDTQHANRNAPALDEEGRPADPIAIAEDRIGANIDAGETANSDELGRSADSPRDEDELPG